jgi:hypothetical protein
VVKEVKVWRRGGGAHPFSSDRNSPSISRKNDPEGHFFI